MLDLTVTPSALVCYDLDVHSPFFFFFFFFLLRNNFAFVIVADGPFLFAPHGVFLVLLRREEDRCEEPGRRTRWR